MAACVASYPAAASFGQAHAVHCHAVTDDGRLRGRAELPVLERTAAEDGHAEVTAP
jgi:hypothetical protein